MNLECCYFCRKLIAEGDIEIVFHDLGVHIVRANVFGTAHRNPLPSPVWIFVVPLNLLLCHVRRTGCSSQRVEHVMKENKVQFAARLLCGGLQVCERLVQRSSVGPSCGIDDSHKSRL